MLDGPEFARWRETASDALANARAAAERDAHHWSCFLCEQSAQLALKALLHGLGAAAWGHDALDLGERAAAAAVEPLTREAHEALVRLGRHYIASRYPDAHPSGTPAGHFTGADASQAISDAQLVLGWVDEQWVALVDPIDDGDGQPAEARQDGPLEDGGDGTP